MYFCQQCGCDVTAEVEGELSDIVNGPTPGQLFGLDVNKFMLHYLCRSCQEKSWTPTNGSQE